MKRLKQYLTDFILSIKVSSKLTIIMLFFVMLPILFIAVFTFYNMRQTIIREEESTAHAVLHNSLEHLDDVLESCLQTTQMVKSNTLLYEQLELLKNPDNINDEGLEKLNEVQSYSIGQLQVANPHISSVRLYLNNPLIAEQYPTIYPFESIRSQPWYSTPLSLNNNWKFNYTDSLTKAATYNQETYAVLLNELPGLDSKSYGVIAVSTEMKTLFRNMYLTENHQWMGFVDATGSLHYSKNRPTNEWGNVIGSVVYAANQGGREYSSRIITVGSHTLLVAGIPVPQLSGRLIWAVMLDDSLKQLRLIQFIFIVCLGLFIIICTLIVNRLAKMILRRFYSLMDIAKEVQRGNLSVAVPDMGHDEIGEFASDFRETIKQIQILLKNSVNRELLVKTTEIRALQNQINSHFIYNVLESIKMMAEIEDQIAISDAVTSLGKLLRYSMKWASSMVTLDEELDYIQDYIALLNLRYDYTITLNLDIPAHIYKEKIPKMSLQPIIENAVYHGIEELDDDAVIRIKVNEFTTYFEVEITDTGKGMTEDKLGLLRKRIYGVVRNESRKRGGIGLRNVQERIQLCFGQEYGLNIFSQESCYTKVVVKLPFDGKGEADEKPADC